MSNVTPTTIDSFEAVTIHTGLVDLTAVHTIGPRIAALRVAGGDNLLLWKPAQYTRGEWDLRGGHRVWVTRPGADENEDTYATDNGPCDVELIENGFRLTGAENPVNRTRRGMTITVIQDRVFRVDNFVTNTGDMLYSGGLWALTCTVPSPKTTYVIPLGDGSSWDAFSMVSFREWGGHGVGGFNDPQFETDTDVLRICPQGLENKRMIQSHHGIIAMSDASRDVTFIKHATYQPNGLYPLNTNIAAYIGPDNFMVEMETMGPESTLKPGETQHHIETWTLVNKALSCKNAKAIMDNAVRDA